MKQIIISVMLFLLLTPAIAAKKVHPPHGADTADPRGTPADFVGTWFPQQHPYNPKEYVWYKGAKDQLGVGIRCASDMRFSGDFVLQGDDNTPWICLSIHLDKLDPNKQGTYAPPK